MAMTTWRRELDDAVKFNEDSLFGAVWEFDGPAEILDVEWGEEDAYGEPYRLVPAPPVALRVWTRLYLYFAEVDDHGEAGITSIMRIPDEDPNAL
jgi:hypothetical protein